MISSHRACFAPHFHEVQLLSTSTFLPLAECAEFPPWYSSTFLLCFSTGGFECCIISLKILTEIPDWLKDIILFQNYFISVASRFKTFKNYLYQYTTESRNAMAGTVNGVQMSCQVVYCLFCLFPLYELLWCWSFLLLSALTWAVTFLQVEIEVPQTCKFIMKTTDCSLREMSSIRPERKPGFVRPSSSDDFFVAMNRLTVNILHIIWNKMWHLSKWRTLTL